jgi:hypothetical protein
MCDRRYGCREARLRKRTDDGKSAAAARSRCARAAGRGVSFSCSRSWLGLNTRIGLVGGWVVLPPKATKWYGNFLKPCEGFHHTRL